MSNDKITVDDPLISTDVDHLIRTIAERGRISLTELMQLCKIDKKTTDNWVSVLEEEGYVTVEYGLRGTYVKWSSSISQEKSGQAGEEATIGTPSVSQSQYYTSESPVASSIQNKKPQSEIDPKILKDSNSNSNGAMQFHDDRKREKSSDGPAIDASMGSSSESSGTDDSEKDPTPESSDEFSPVISPNDDSAEPEELLSQYLERKQSKPEKKDKDTKIGQEVTDIDALRSHILTSLDESESDVSQDTSDENISDADTNTDSNETQDNQPGPADSDDSDGGSSISSYSLGVRATPVIKSSRPLSKEQRAESSPSSNVTGMRELINSYMDEINKEKAKIEQLNRERETIYRDNFSALEGRLQADISVLAQKVMEKENKVLELKERFLELPDKVDSLGKVQEQMDRIRSESASALVKVKKGVADFVSKTASSKAGLEDKIAQLDSEIVRQTNELSELDNLRAQLDARSEKLRSTIDSAKSQLDDISNTMDSLVEDLGQLEVTKSEIDSTSKSVRESISVSTNELRSLREELESVSSSNVWLEGSIQDYENQIRDIEDYVSRTDEDIAELRESAESTYLKKYLSELERISESYASNLSSTINNDQQIANKIDRAKARIAELISESQEMVRKLRNEVVGSKDYEAALSKAKARASKVRATATSKSSGSIRSKANARVLTASSRSKSAKRSGLSGMASGRPKKKVPAPRQIKKKRNK